MYIRISTYNVNHTNFSQHSARTQLVICNRICEKEQHPTNLTFPAALFVAGHVDFGRLLIFFMNRSYDMLYLRQTAYHLNTRFAVYLCRHTVPSNGFGFSEYYLQSVCYSGMWLTRFSTFAGCGPFSQCCVIFMSLFVHPSSVQCMHIRNSLITKAV